MSRTQERRSSGQNRPPQNTETAVVRVDPKEAARSIQTSLEGRRGQFLDLLGQDERLVDRFLTVALASVVKSSDLLEADPLSIVNSVRDAAQMGLEPAGPLGEGAIVAYRDSSTGRKVAQFQPMVRGLRKLALNEPDVTVVNVGIRHAKDHFVYREGSDPVIEHVPWIDDEDPGEVMGAYAYARHRGELLVLYMNLAQIRKRRSVARSQKMWEAWPEEMMKKTVLRRLIAEKLPLRTERIARAISVDEADLDRMPTSASDRPLIGPGSRTRARLAGEDAPETPQDGPSGPEGQEGAPAGSEAPRASCGAVGPDGIVCVLDPHSTEDGTAHEAADGRLWG